MEETQSFRLAGMAEMKDIPVHCVDGQSVVFWENVQKTFPGVMSVKNGKEAVPLYIKHFPGVVLDVAALPSEIEFVEALKATSVSPVSPISDDCSHTLLTSSSSPSLSSGAKSSNQALSFVQVVNLATKQAKESGDRVLQQELSAKMDLMLKSQWHSKPTPFSPP